MPVICFAAMIFGCSAITVGVHAATLRLGATAARTFNLTSTAAPACAPSGARYSAGYALAAVMIIGRASRSSLSKRWICRNRTAKVVPWFPVIPVEKGPLRAGGDSRGHRVVRGHGCDHRVDRVATVRDSPRIETATGPARKAPGLSLVCVAYCTVIGHPLKSSIAV